MYACQMHFYNICTYLILFKIGFIKSFEFPISRSVTITIRGKIIVIIVPFTIIFKFVSAIELFGQIDGVEAPSWHFQFQFCQ